MPVQDQGDPGIPTSTQGRTDPLDYAWWASDGPTAGYLTRRALEALGDADEPQVRHVHLHVLGSSTAGAPLDISVTRARGAEGIGLSTVTYRQLGPFAIALLIVGDARGGTEPGDATPPTALPRETYRPMTTPTTTLPPVTAQFEYRPTTDSDGRGPRSGWDVVWVTPTDAKLEGKLLIASVIDSWFPPSFIRTVNTHLRAQQEELRQPAPTTLIGASISFPADQSTYDHAEHILMANQHSAVADGFLFERSEIWSERGELLATAELIRRRHAGHSHR